MDKPSLEFKMSLKARCMKCGHQDVLKMSMDDVAGPLSDLISAEILKERERCAKVAESFNVCENGDIVADAIRGSR